MKGGQTTWTARRATAYRQGTGHGKSPLAQFVTVNEMQNNQDGEELSHTSMEGLFLHSVGPSLRVHMFPFVMRMTRGRTSPRPPAWSRLTNILCG